MAYLISVVAFALLCIIIFSIMCVIIRIQEKKFKQYLNEQICEIINTINHSTRDMIAMAIDIVDSKWRGNHEKNS